MPTIEIDDEEIRQLRETLRQANLDLNFATRGKKDLPPGFGGPKMDELRAKISGLQTKLDSLEPAAAIGRMKTKGFGETTGELARGRAATRPAEGPSYDVPRPAPDDLTGFDVEGMRRALGGRQPSQDNPKSTPDASKAPGVELGPEPPEPPLDAFYQRGSPEGRQSAEERLARKLGASPADMEGEFAKDTEEAAKEKRAKARKDYIDRFGRPPTSFRETPEGDILPVLSEQDYAGTVNWLKLDKLASDAARSRQLATGEDKLGERQLKLQDDAQAAREALQTARMESQIAEAQRKESVKQEEVTRKEQAAYNSDSADALSFAGSKDASPEERAFADYMQSIKKGAPGEGLPEEGLQAAIVGAKRLRNRVSGLGPSDQLDGRSFGDSARRNVSRFLSDAETELSTSFQQVSGRSQALQAAQSPGAGIPEPPEQLPTDPAFNPITEVGGARGPNTELLRGMSAQMMGNIPGYAGTGGVSVGQAEPITALGMGIKRMAMLQSPMGPTLQPSQSRFLPTTQSAATMLQKALATKGPVQRAISSLSVGLGTDDQRKKLMSYLVTYAGFDPNQFALRTSLESDPQWNKIVSEQVLEGIRRTRMGQGQQGPAK